MKRGLFFGILTIAVSTILFLSIAKTIQNSNKESITKKEGINDAMEWMGIMKNNKTTNSINPVDILNARKAVEKLSLLKGKAALNLQWAELGPNNVGGRTRAILIDKNNPNLLYAGGVAGGLWTSSTGGSSWVNITSIDQNLAISCIAQGPNGEIYVGTGEGLGTPSGENYVTPHIIGNGIYKSTNGVDFIQLTSTTPTPNNSDVEWALVSRLACDPNTGRVYAATNRGLRMSDDGGATWSNPVLFPGGSPYNQNSTDVKVASDGSVVAAVYNKCFYSSNGNTGTFVNQSTGASGMLPSSNLSRIELAFAPSDPNYIYCVAANQNGIFHNIYQSKDKGNTWTIIAPGGSQNFELFGRDEHGQGQGWYDNVIAVFPDNPNKVIVGGIDAWIGNKVSETGYFNWQQVSRWYLEPTDRQYVHADHHVYVFHPTDPKILYLGTDGGVSKTTDACQNFSTLNINYNVTQFYAIACSGTGEVMGGTQDNGTPYISRKGNTPMSAVFVKGGDGGWAAFSLINTEAMFATTYFGLVSRSPNKFQSAQEETVFFSPRMLTNAIPNIGASFVTPILLWESFSDSKTKDSTNFVATTDYIVGDTLLVRSKNNNYPFYHITNTPIAIGDTIKIKDPIQTKFFIGGTSQVWMTMEGIDFSRVPASWMRISNTVSGTVQAMATSKDGNYLFVGTQSGYVYRISNLLYAYDSISGDVASVYCVVETKQIAYYANRSITSIAVDPSNPERVIITLGNYGNTAYIYYSENALDETPTFTSKQGDLPAMPVYASLIELNNANTVLIGTEYGVFATDDITASSPSWTEENTGMARVPTFMIRQQIINQPSITIGSGTSAITYPGVSNYGAIYIGTHGRGIFECLNYIGIEEDPINIKTFSGSNMSIYPNPVVGTKATVAYNLTNKSKITFNIFDLSGKLVHSYDNGEQSVGKHSYILDCNTLTRGTYIIQLVAGTNHSSSKFIVSK